METRDLIFSVVMVFSAFVLAYRLLDKYGGDSVIVMSTVMLFAMLGLLFLSMSMALKRVETEIKEKERSLRVSLQSVEEEVREKVDTVVRSLNEVAEQIPKKGYR